MLQSNKRGFTLAEMLVVLAILCVLLIVSNSGNNRARESQIGEGARMNLINIFNCEKRYKLTSGVYFFAGSLAEINSGLGTGISDGNFTYRVVNNPAGFEAIATRTDGVLCGGKELSITASGGEVAEQCPVW